MIYLIKEGQTEEEAFAQATNRMKNLPPRITSNQSVTEVLAELGIM